MGKLKEKRPGTTWRWFLKSKKVQGRGSWPIGAGMLEVGLLPDDARTRKGL